MGSAAIAVKLFAIFRSPQYRPLMKQIVYYEEKDGIATIRMDDGKVNKLSHAMWDGLDAAFDKAEAAGAVVLFTGREGKFSAGFDLDEMYKGPQEAINLTCRGSEFAVRLMKFGTPVITVSTGHCLAMGAFLALASDYRIGADGPFKVGLNETQIGMTMHDFGIELARYKIAPTWFNRAAINGEVMSPRDAVQAGYYDKVVAPDALMATAQGTAEMFKMLKMHAFNGTKNKSRRELFKVFNAAIEADRNMAVTG